jgi:NAD(P)-dependent dehydrogenase (short-subunit alcohol dehydrogenase family)
MGVASVINVLSPGHIETPGLSGLMSADQKTEAVALVPLGRIGTPEDLGKVAVFLAWRTALMSLALNSSSTAAWRKFDQVR